ncbi:MAG: HepT-like ribonuclease domain-containing protein [bacterium]
MATGEYLSTLKKYLEKEPQISLSFLFGSLAKGFIKEESDFDLAIYLQNPDEEERIWFEITRIIKRELDLVYLNGAPASLVSNIFKTGIPLVIKDKSLYLELYLKKTLEAEDFFEWTKDYYRIYKNARSLIPEEKTRLLQRMQFLETEYKEIDNFSRYNFKEYQQDKFKRRNIERWVENILNATIDISKIILASAKRQMPKTYEEALFDFGIFIGLEEEVAQKFAKFGNLRNILAHEYLDLIYNKIQNFIQEAPLVYTRLFSFLKEFMGETDDIPH